MPRGQGPDQEVFERDLTMGLVEEDVIPGG